MKPEEKQALIDAISTKMRSIIEEHDENLQFEYDVLKLALTALTAQPVKLPIKWRPCTCVDCDIVLDYQDTVAAIRAAGYEVQE